jgi:hypothetical protein
MRGGLDYLLFYSLFGVSLSSRDVLKFGFENPIIACSWQLVVFMLDHVIIDANGLID